MEDDRNKRLHNRKMTRRVWNRKVIAAVREDSTPYYIGNNRNKMRVKKSKLYRITRWERELI